MMLGMQIGTPNRFEFGNFRLDAEERSLVREGHGAIPLPPKVFDLLVVLVRHSGHLLTREELLKAVWPDSFVEENNLTVNISLLRKVLGTNNDGTLFIETVPKRGYRFRGAVCETPKPIASESDPETTNLGSADHPAPELAATPPPPLPPVSATEPTRAQRQRHLAWILVLLVLLLAAASLLIWKERAKPHPTPPAPPASAPLSLAVMPFRNLRQDPGTDYLGFALADSIINRLAYVSELSVRPSSSVAPYVAAPAVPRRVAAELSVSTLLTGTYVEENGKLRISTQLVDPATERMLWQQTMDVRFQDMLQTEDQVAQAVVSGLSLHLAPGEAQHLASTGTVNAQAYEEYLRGVDLYSSGAYRDAIRVLEHAVTIDSSIAPIWAMLGRAYTTNASLQFGGEQGYAKALAAYQKALALDPTLIACRVYMANLFTDTGRVESAVPLLREALALNPNYAEGNWELSYAYRFAGLLPQSVQLAERARRLDPNVKRYSSAINAYLYLGQPQAFLNSLPPPGDNPYILFYRGFGEFYLHQSEAAARDFDRAWELDPTLLQTQVGRALSLGLQQQPEKGLSLLRSTEAQIARSGVRDPEALYKLAQAYAVLGDKASALRVFAESIRSGFFCYPCFLTDPLLNNLRNEPRFPELLAEAHQRFLAFRQTWSPSSTT